MKRPLLLAILLLMPSLPVFAGGATGGFGIILQNNKELSLRYVGQFENLSLLRASLKNFNTIGTVQNPNVTIRLEDRIIRGRIKEPEFIDAVSIETSDGNNLVIINEADVGDQPDTAPEN